MKSDGFSKHDVAFLLLYELCILFFPLPSYCRAAFFHASPCDARNEWPNTETSPQFFFFWKCGVSIRWMKHVPRNNVKAVGMLIYASRCGVSKRIRGPLLYVCMYIPSFPFAHRATSARKRKVAIVAIRLQYIHVCLVPSDLIRGIMFQSTYLFRNNSRNYRPVMSLMGLG